MSALASGSRTNLTLKDKNEIKMYLLEDAKKPLK
jgi:hypothetical protein